MGRDRRLDPPFPTLNNSILQDGIFLVITAEPAKDFDIPTQGLTFGTLIRAQALGDFEALLEAKKKAIRIHLPTVEAVAELVKALE